MQSLDDSVGRILERLDSRGLSGRTIVIFLSDNGGYIGPFDGQPVTNNYPLRSGKGSLYEGGVRVPLIIKWPGVESVMGVCHEPVYVADLYPTLLEIAGMNGDKSRNAKMDGQSLAPLFKKPQASLGREALYFHFPHYYATTTPVIWAYDNIWQLTARYPNFSSVYGWNWSGFDFSSVAEVDYPLPPSTRTTQKLKRYAANAAGTWQLGPGTAGGLSLGL